MLSSFFIIPYCYYCHCLRLYYHYYCYDYNFSNMIGIIITTGSLRLLSLLLLPLQKLSQIQNIVINYHYKNHLILLPLFPLTLLPLLSLSSNPCILPKHITFFSSLFLPIYLSSFFPFNKIISFLPLSLHHLSHTLLLPLDTKLLSKPFIISFPS